MTTLHRFIPEKDSVHFSLSLQMCVLLLDKPGCTFSVTCASQVGGADDL